MIYSYWDIECDRLKLVVMGPFFPFTTLKTKKNQNQKKKKEKIIKNKKKKRKNCRIYHHFTQVYQKPQSYQVRFLRYRVRHNFLSFWLIFCLFSANNLENQNFKHVYLKSRSYDVCFLRYRVQQTYFFAILGHFFPFPYWPRKLKFGKNVINPEDIIILHMSTIKIIWCMVPEL